MNDKLITSDQVASILAILPSDLERLRFKGQGPSFVQLEGGAIRYRPADIEDYLRRRSVRLTYETGLLFFRAQRNARARTAREETCAEIFGHEISPDGVLCFIVACFRVNLPQPGDDPRYQGQLVFRCPFCGDLHLHGAAGPNQGDGDGHRAPHCWTQGYFNQYGYILREVDNPFQAGTLPKKIVNDYYTQTNLARLQAKSGTSDEAARG